MKVIRILVAALLGCVLGIAIGIGTTVYVVATTPHDDPRNPGAQATAPLFGVVAVPVCLIGGLITGVQAGMAWNDWLDGRQQRSNQSKIERSTPDSTPGN